MVLGAQHCAPGEWFISSWNTCIGVKIDVLVNARLGVAAAVLVETAAMGEFRRTLSPLEDNGLVGVPQGSNGCRK